MFKVCSLALVLSSAFAAPVKYTMEDCGASTTHGHVQKLTSYPSRPSTGEYTNLTLHIKKDEALTGGLFEVKVTCLGLTLKKVHGAFCNSSMDFKVYFAPNPLWVAKVHVYALPCPLYDSGDVVPVTFGITLAKDLPPGFSNFNFLINAKDQNDADLVCSKVHGSVLLESGAGQSESLQLV